MNKEPIFMAKLKCIGCASTIRKELLNLNMVEGVSVNIACLEESTIPSTKNKTI